MRIRTGAMAIWIVMMALVGCAHHKTSAVPTLQVGVSPVPLHPGHCQLVAAQTLTVHHEGGLQGGVYMLPHDRVMTIGGQIKCDNDN